MRAIVMRVDQLERSLGATGGTVGMIRQGLRADLDEEPSIAEIPRIDLSGN